MNNRSSVIQINKQKLSEYFDLQRFITMANIPWCSEEQNRWIVTRMCSNNHKQNLNYNRSAGKEKAHLKKKKKAWSSFSFWI